MRNIAMKETSVDYESQTTKLITHSHTHMKIHLQGHTTHFMK